MTVKVVFHEFSMGDVEDPYLYAAHPISQWQQSEHGSWVMQHVIGEPVLWCEADPSQWGYRVTITGQLTEKDHTYFQLRWGMSVKQ